MIRALNDLDIHVQGKYNTQQEERVNSRVLWSTEEDSNSDTIFIGGYSTREAPRQPI